MISCQSVEDMTLQTLLSNLAPLFYGLEVYINAYELHFERAQDETSVGEWCNLYTGV